MTLVAGMALAGFVARAEPLGAGPAPFRWVTCANTALAGSALLYGVYSWLRAEAIGRAATALAAGGAIGVLSSLALGMLSGGGIGLYESTAFLSAAAVLAYLALERAYGSRSAGIVVMLGVMVAVPCQMWLITHGLAATGRLPEGLGTYWEAGYRFAVCLGYCPIVAAGVLAALTLGEQPRDPGYTPGAAALAALSVGAPLLLLGAGMGVIWSITGRTVTLRAVVHIALGAAIGTFALIAWLRTRSPSDPRLVRHAIGVFAASTGWLLFSDRLTEAFG